MKNKEYGSDFHYVVDSRFCVSKDNVTQYNSWQLYFSGRAALYALLKNGIEKLSWRKIYLPSYYCHEVDDFIKELNIELDYYKCNPFTKESDSHFVDEKGHVLLVVNYFGTNILDVSAFKHLAIIEDVTHALASAESSKADYVFGSLRKTLPIPAGGFLKVNNNLQINEASIVSAEAEKIALERLSGMVLKRKYLEREFAQKDVFRELLIHSESQFALKETNVLLPTIIKELLFSFDFKKIYFQKQKNSRFIKQFIQTNDLFEVITNDNDLEFAFIMNFETQEERDSLRNYLISKDIYPIVLWPNQICKDDVEIENTILMLHIDFRYDEQDMMYFSQVVNEYISKHAIQNN